MKKINLNKLVTIFILALFLLSGNVTAYVYCESEDCCKTEFCEDNSVTPQSAKNTGIDNTDCCNHNLIFQTDKKAVISFNKTINISAPESINIYFSETPKNITVSQVFSADKISQTQSTTILRI